jgi:regulatory protein
LEGTITQIAPQPRRGGRRLNVFLDDRYALSVDLELASTLHIGQHISHADFERLRGDDERARAMDAALRLLGYRPRSTQELTMRLAGKGFTPDLIHAVLERLARLDLVNDQSFAQYWVQQRQGRAPRGQRLITQELRRKGIDAETARQATDESSEDESELAYRAGLKKAQSLAGLDVRTFQQRLCAYLQRRGFDWEATRAAERRLRAEMAVDE